MDVSREMRLKHCVKMKWLVRNGFGVEIKCICLDWGQNVMISRVLWKTPEVREMGLLPG